jgi:two-component system copper resistance phosphate regulon response regulator CusR
MRILIIEDEAKTAHAIRGFLEECHHTVDCTFDGYTGRLFAERNQYDVIVSDIVMPNVNGIDLCRHLRAHGVNTPILMLSALNQADDKVTGLDAGADDYLAKPFDLHELHARLNALARRAGKGSAPSSRLLTTGDLELNLDTFAVRRAGQPVVLRPREFALLEFLVRNQDRVVSKTEIAEQVWGLDADVNLNVIEVYVNYLRNKIDKSFPTRLIHTHYGSGYILKTS